MVERLKKVDSGFLLVLALSLLAIWPFLVNSQLPRETDAELHIFRLAELSRLVRAGEFYPRWAPNFYFGYGYPIFNYYAPLVYYLGLPVELLPGVDAVAAVKAVFILGLLGGSLGMYGFVRSNWGRAAGFVAAAAYLYAPYILYVDPHARGDLAESFSLGLLPLALWALDRLRRGGGALNWLLATLLVAAIILAHNLMALVFFAILLAWSAWQWLSARLGWAEASAPGMVGSAGQQALRLFGPLLLGVGLAAFFWLPVALEQNAVNLSNLVGDGGHFDFRNHFLDLGELLGPSPRLDWGATAPEFAFNLGIGQWLLAAGGLIALLAGAVRQRTHAVFFALLALALLFMMTPASAFVWEAVPLLPYVQFPWRLLGATVFALAVLGGVGTEAFLRFAQVRWPRPENWLPALLIAPLLLLALPLIDVPPWPDAPWDTSAEGVVQVERQGRWLGTTSTADFVPATVDIIPRPADELLQNFSEGVALDRVNRATLPENVTVVSEPLSPLHTRYLVSTPQPFLLRLFQFDFPGWEARIDGQVVETELARPEGFLVVPVPAGDHVVEVKFTSTPARRLAWSIALASALLTLAGAWLLGRRAETAREGLAAADQERAGERPILVLAAAVLGLYLLLSPQGIFHLRSTGMAALPASQASDANFGGQIALLGFDAPEAARPGETVEVTLYWKAQEELDINYQVFLHLLGPDGAPVAQSDKLNPGEFPTRRWPLDKYVRDTHRLSLPLDLPPGDYVLSTGLWVQAEGWRLPLLDDAGEQIGDHFVLQYLQVE